MTCLAVMLPVPSGLLVGGPVLLEGPTFALLFELCLHILFGHPPPFLPAVTLSTAVCSSVPSAFGFYNLFKKVQHTKDFLNLFITLTKHFHA